MHHILMGELILLIADKSVVSPFAGASLAAVSLDCISPGWRQSQIACPCSFNGMSPERKAAQAMISFFTFVAIRCAAHMGEILSILV